jgi:hypothetical protein
MKKEEIVVEIARILIKRELPNWDFNLANEALKSKYLIEAAYLYQMFLKNNILRKE